MKNNKYDGYLLFIKFMRVIKFSSHLRVFSRVICRIKMQEKPSSVYLGILERSITCIYDNDFSVCLVEKIRVYFLLIAGIITRYKKENNIFMLILLYLYKRKIFNQ